MLELVRLLGDRSVTKLGLKKSILERQNLRRWAELQQTTNNCKLWRSFRLMFVGVKMQRQTAHDNKEQGS